MTQRPESVDELLRRFRCGDHEAFRRLVEPHRAVLRARADRWLDVRIRRKASLDDVLQNALLVAFEQREAFDSRGPGALRPWLLGIVDNCARDLIRRFGRAQRRDAARERSGVGHPDALDATDPTPSQHAVTNERVELLQQARATLPSADRELLQLVHDEHLPLRAAATKLGRTYEAVKKQHGRALIRLGHALDKLKSTHDR